MKSKIEEKIKNAREATNEMFAAFEELNERLSEKIEHKHKEPIIGEMAIFWDNAKCNAFVAKYKGIINSMQHCSRNDSLYINAILFESVDQYKEFLKS